MGLGWIRWWTCKSVKGDVLEASCGTGRNIPYYDTSVVKSITFVDQSPEMLDVAKLKWEAKKQNEVSVIYKAQPMEGLSPNREQYDTILQTFGLCSVANPSGYLAHLASFVRPTGRIILIEHGRSRYDWLNKVLDTSVEKHAAKWGCYYNRDIEGIVRSCQDLEIESMSRYHLGTTYVYHLKPLSR